ncbi:MAG TPA: hypothetical protein VKT99_01795, partial [Xanthobacteraceae bacterium]|nr:hypothetical protein [Xanthobacteraceae bacterium]
GSKRPETSASCGPVATSPGSSIRPLAGAENRTTRVLPNPDNSCAYDKKTTESGQNSRCRYNRVASIIREMISQHSDSDGSSKFPVIFPVLRENGILVGAANLRTIGGKSTVMPRYHMRDT